MANENLKKQMVVKLGTTTNTEAQLISNMVDGALSGKGGDDPELENLKKQMVIKLGTTTNEDAQIISNMVDNAAGGGGGGTILPLLTVALTTNGEYFLGGEALPIIENNIVTPGVVSVANTETIYKFLPIPMNDGGNLIAGAAINDKNNAIISAAWATGTNVINTSNEVNCQVIEPEPGWKTVIITDIYSPASITINFSHNE